jgi:hypothetical protein
MKNINFADLFKPNRYNINPDDLNINDVIITNGLGLMELVEKCEAVQDENLISSLHGQPLFKMKKLFGKDDTLWILYSSSFTDKMEYVKMATDDDIIKEIVERTCEYDIGTGASLTLTNYSKEGGFAIYKKDEGSVNLSTKEAHNLREILNRFLD